MRRPVPCFSILAVALIVATLPAGAGNDAQNSAAVPKTVRLEVAPEDLGGTLSDDLLYVTSDGSETTIAAFSNEKSELLVFDESGDRWGRPVALRDTSGWPLSVSGVHFDVVDGWAGITNYAQTHLFKPDGTALCSTDEFDGAFDIEGFRRGEWVLSITHRASRDDPHKHTAKELASLPRLVIINDDCEISETGLLARDRDKISGSAAAGRTLLLAVAKKRIFAAEAANYRIYELDHRLRPRATFSDPELFLEDGYSDEEADEEIRLRRAEDFDAAGAEIAAQNERRKDLARSQPEPREREAPVAVVLRWVPVIRAIEWDPHLDRLLVLLSPEVAGGPGAIDLLDPDTGRIERFLLRIPSDLPHPKSSFSQLAVSKRFIWFSSATGDSPTYRLDRSLLMGGTKLVLTDELGIQN